VQGEFTLLFKDTDFKRGIFRNEVVSGAQPYNAGTRYYNVILL
jgi:hypothetical protein